MRGTPPDETMVAMTVISTLVVVRPRRALGLRAFPIEVDGAPAGAVGNGKELMLAVKPGAHRVRCAGGPPLRVHLGPGETVRVEVGPNHTLIPPGRTDRSGRPFGTRSARRRAGTGRTPGVPAPIG